MASGKLFRDMTQVALTSRPTVVEVDAIAAMANPVLRNLAITECYAALSAAMRARTGDGCAYPQLQALATPPS